MPDTLNKQSIINLLIDSPLREPIKINLIDIVNNTSEADLPKVYSTITKELEIFQKATERRMKLADETIAKLSGGTPATLAPSPTTPSADSSTQMDNSLPPTPTPPPTPQPSAAPTTESQDNGNPPPLSVPPLDLPPLPTSPTTPPTASETNEPVTPTPPPTPPPAMPAPQPLGAPPVGTSSDEDALAEIQKELDSLKSETAADISTQAAPVAPAAAPAQ